MHVQHDPWLSQVLCRPTFSVHDVDRGGGATQALRDHAARSPGAFYFARVASTDIAGISALSAAGFQVIEASLTFARAVEGAPPSVEERGIEVGPAIATWRESVLDIAGSAFRFSRFHLDPRIDRAAADRVKREWVRSYFEGRRGDRLLVAVDGGEPVGFVAIMLAKRPEGAAAVIDLIGVRSDQQGRGIGRQLVEAAAVECRGRAGVLEVGTQSANVPSIRLYEEAGFKVARSGFVLHRHAPSM